MAKQKLTLDLKKNPEVANLVATMEPGDTIILETSIQAKDDQTLTLSLDSATSADGNEAEGAEPIAEAEIPEMEAEEMEAEEITPKAKAPRSLMPDM